MRLNKATTSLYHIGSIHWLVLSHWHQTLVGTVTLTSDIDWYFHIVSRHALAGTVTLPADTGWYCHAGSRNWLVTTPLLLLTP